MINKTRIVGNNFGEGTYKIQNKWRKYKKTECEDFVKRDSLFSFVRIFDPGKQSSSLRQCSRNLHCTDRKLMEQVVMTWRQFEEGPLVRAHCCHPDTGVSREISSRGETTNRRTRAPATPAGTATSWCSRTSGTTSSTTRRPRRIGQTSTPSRRRPGEADRCNNNTYLHLYLSNYNHCNI